ncbi:MAG: inositol monophosphatase family protein [Opitutaceae bacterium]
MNANFKTAIETRLDSIETMLSELEQILLSLQQGDLGVVKKSNEFDLVTKADVESESRLVAHIRQNFSEDAIVAEEGGSDEAAGDATRFCWVLDPIDGTTNFANRLPVWGISIALMHDGTLVGGIVSAPGLGLRYRAVKSAGATCNGTAISVNTNASIGDGIIATGFPYDRAKRAQPICRALENILRIAGGVRRLGAASLDFCFVADGRYSGYYEMGLKPWDYAAGVLIAMEAGATVTDFNGAPLDIFTSKGAVVTNGNFHDELLRQTSPMLEAIALK